MEPPGVILRPAAAEIQTLETRYRVATLYPVSISSRFSPSPPVLPCTYPIAYPVPALWPWHPRWNRTEPASHPVATL
jgi:hypothetical protein